MDTLIGYLAVAGTASLSYVVGALLYMFHKTSIEPHLKGYHWSPNRSGWSSGPAGCWVKKLDDVRDGGDPGSYV